jgi:hypothetical protein
VVLTDAYTQLPATPQPSSPAAAAAAAAAAPAAPAMTAAETAAAEEASRAARFLGVVMVPGRHLVKAEVEEPDAAAAAVAATAS